MTERRRPTEPPSCRIYGTNARLEAMAWLLERVGEDIPAAMMPGLGGLLTDLAAEIGDAAESVERLETSADVAPRP